MYICDRYDPLNLFTESALRAVGLLGFETYTISVTKPPARLRSARLRDILRSDLRSNRELDMTKLYHQRAISGLPICVYAK